MALNFPDAPSNGQKYTDSATSETWTYESSTNSWTSDGLTTAVGVQYKGGINITTAPPAGVKGGWQYTVTTGGTANAGFTGLSGNIPTGSTIIFDGANWQSAGAGVLWVRTGTTLAPSSVGDTVAFSAGTAALPGLTPVGDPNTGLYSPGADQVAISTNGTGRLFVDASGNVEIAGTGKRIRGDFSNATHANRLSFQSNVTDGATSPFLIPNGAATTSQLIVANSSDGSNASYALLGCVSTETRLISGVTGTGTNLPLAIGTSGATHVLVSTAGTERLRVTSNGQLLVGTSSWSSSDKLVVRGNTGGDDEARFSLVRGTVPAADQNIGVLHFQQGGANEGARITALRDGGTWTAGSSHPTRLVFSTTADGASSPTERVTITNTGETLFFASSVLTLGSSAAAGTSTPFVTGIFSRTGTQSGGTVSLRIWNNGNIVNTNNSYGSLSDIKLKENIVDANSQWADLKALQVRKFNFKEGQTHTQIGLIAQEVELVSPGLVSESPDRDEDGNDLGTVTKSVNYSVLYMKAVKALQEAMERIEVLEQRLTDAGIA